MPDAKTVWAFRDALKDAKLWESLLLKFEQALLDLGVKLNRGQIIDASFVPVPGPVGACTGPGNPRCRALPTGAGPVGVGASTVGPVGVGTGSPWCRP